MIYIDSSSLLKILWEEPESDAVRQAVAQEKGVVVSILTELETEVQLRARRLAGATTKTHYQQYRNALRSFRETDPFEFHDLPGAVFRRAIDQHLSEKVLHCRTLDRLHLAAMAELGLRRLMTNDRKQAAAARALGLEVICPG
ncbi:MAG: Ribonuclease VapC [Verrucomicrobiales bacterium]|jgi:predicted nucleic acid-binding protein|nr:Ribonuclease VapC [Verrucomicrobiales bacterium]